MLFKFQQSVRMVYVWDILLYIPILLCGVIILSAMLVLTISELINDGFDRGLLITAITIFLINMVGLLFLYSRVIWVFKVFKEKDGWNIEVTNSEIVWEAPAYTEDSFRVKLAEVSKISKLETGNIDHPMVSYSLKMINGRVIHLDTFSDINNRYIY